MILADTSVWIDHFRHGDPVLSKHLMNGRVLIHAFVIGELACGHFNNRQQVFDLLGLLPSAKVATHNEVLYMIEQLKLMGRGIGYVDACLLASCKLMDAQLWTRDKRLLALALDHLIAYEEIKH